MIRDYLTRLSHQSLSLPRKAHPKAPVVVLFDPQTDASDQSPRRILEPQRPMPFFATLHCRESNISVVGVCSVGRKRPWNNLVQIPNDFPLREQELGLFGIVKFERPQQETGCFK